MKCDSESEQFRVALTNETKFFLWLLIFGCLFLRVRYALLHCMCAFHLVCEHLRAKHTAWFDGYNIVCMCGVYVICILYIYISS